jgi:Bifunctional DNA primase/polymerase, N-terminal
VFDEEAPVKLSANGEAALGYALLGWCVFPLAPFTKRPLERFAPHGHNSATCDPEQIERWWRGVPNAGVALSCAMSGLAALDPDHYKPECSFFSYVARLGPLPDTPRQLTPRGGEHYIFRARNVSYRNLGPGVELKHQGYIVLAPSVGPDSPKPYVWDVGAHPLDTPIADLPATWEAELINNAPSRGGFTAVPNQDDAAAERDAGDSWLGHAFRCMGWLGAPLPGRRRAARCPWAHLHTDGRGYGGDSSTVLLPSTSGQTFGGFRCAHAHCVERTWRDVLPLLTDGARWTADRAVRREQTRHNLERLATARTRSAR